MAKSSLIFPDIYTITGEDPKNPNSFLQQLIRCIEKGAKLIQLRAHQLSESEYENLAKESLKICWRYHVILLLNSEIKLVEKLNADGIHLTSKKLLSLKCRPLSRDRIIGASCHNENEVWHAKKISVDFITLSPITFTKSHPEANVIGWHQFANLASQIDVPVFALGGVQSRDLSLAKQNGGHGVAGISAFWNVEDDVIPAKL